MNDIELDRLLDSWQAPAPPRSLRAGVRDRFPRRARRGFGRPLRWGLAIAVATATLAVATEQSDGNPAWYLFGRLRGLVNAFIFGREAHRAAAIRNQIRDANPLVYVDGQPAGPPTYKGGASLWLDVPGEGTYGIEFVNMNRSDGVSGWVENGNVEGRVLQFRAGAKRVRIEFDRPVTDTEVTVFTLHR